MFLLATLRYSFLYNSSVFSQDFSSMLPLRCRPIAWWYEYFINALWKCRCIKKLKKFSLFKRSFFYRYLVFHFYFIYYLRFEKKRKIQTKYLRDYGERDETLDAPEVFDWISCVTWEETFFISRWIPTWYIFYLKFWIKSIVLTKGDLQICTIDTGLISYYTFKIRLFQNPFSELMNLQNNS